MAKQRILTVRPGLSYMECMDEDVRVTEFEVRQEMRRQLGVAEAQCAWIDFAAEHEQDDDGMYAAADVLTFLGW
jgi:hypothetical protein